MGILKTYNFHNLLSLNIYRSRPSPFDQYLDTVFSHYETTARPEADLSFMLTEGAEFPKDGFWIDGKYCITKDCISYHEKYKNARWHTHIERLESGKTKITISGNIFCRPVVAGETLLSFVRYKLAQKNCLLIHASGLGFAGKGFCFAGRGGVGKTITAINGVRQGGVLFGDDSVIVGPSGQMFSFALPFNLRFTYDIQKLLGISFPLPLRAEIVLKKLLGWISFGKYKLFTILPVQSIYKNSIGESIRLNKCFVLFRGPGFEINTRADREELFRQILSIIRFESSELSSVLAAYGHIYPQSFPNHFWQQYDRMLRENFRDVTVCRVSIPKRYENEYFKALWQEATR